MINRRPSEDRGETQIGWLDGKHSFSFGDYYDPNFMGFGPLRVINEDQVQPGKGFPAHSHSDMEIITYVIEGELEHKDSMENSSIIRPGEIQYMSAGTGVTHSEHNQSDKNLLHFLQIWIQPDEKGYPPQYDQRELNRDDARGKLLLMVSNYGKGNSIEIHQDVELYLLILSPGQEIIHPVKPGRKVWVQIVKGEMNLNETQLKSGDGAAVQNEGQLAIKASLESEVLIFDMA